MFSCPKINELIFFLVIWQTIVVVRLLSVFQLPITHAICSPDTWAIARRRGTSIFIQILEPYLRYRIRGNCIQNRHRLLPVQCTMRLLNIPRNHLSFWILQIILLHLGPQLDPQYSTLPFQSQHLNIICGHQIFGLPPKILLYLASRQLPLPQ